MYRHTKLANGSVRESTTYAITSLPRSKANATFLLDQLRGRWHIENRGFYVLDVSLGDDANRRRTGHAGRALHAIRSMALNLARRLDKSTTQLCRGHALKPNLAEQTTHPQN